MASADCGSEEENLETLESAVKALALKVSDYRKRLANNLKNTVDCAITSHRPSFHNIDSESKDTVVSRSGAHLGPKEPEFRDRYVQLKETLCGNVATVPLVVKRMRECKETMDRSTSLNGTIYPAFTRRKLTNCSV